MTTLEKIKAEIEQLQDGWFKETDGWWCYEKALQIIDKYAEQETDIEYIGEFCHKHGLVLMSKEMADKYAEQEPCDDVVSRQDALNAVTFSEVRWQAIERIKQLPPVRPQKQIPEQWQELKETIVELRDNNGTCTQQEVCKFLANYMGVLEKQMVKQEPKAGHWINKEFRKEEYVLTGTCSVCGRVSVIDEFCHHCGARMESEVQE